MNSFVGFCIVSIFVFSVGYGLAQAVKENLFNYRLREDLLRQHREKESELGEKESQLARLEHSLHARDAAFKAGILSGRRWLASFIADTECARDALREESLRLKKPPAPKTAEVIASFKLEKREAKAALKFLEYQLRSYEEYFPFLEEFRDLILDERVSLSADRDNLKEIEQADPVLQYLAREEYDRLSATERNQRAIDLYLARHLSSWGIGKFYERYLGYLWEKDRWRVLFNGVIKGFEDFGRDLICTKGTEVEIVQAKCWSGEKLIHEKHVFQLFATCVHYILEHPSSRVTPVLAATTSLSPAAAMVAEKLGVQVRRIPLSKSYPMIKCNVNPHTKERIYHLPFDQQYDYAVIGTIPGECYASTVHEAERMGFRRAWRFRG